jgi:hypothetical protein
VFIDACRIQNCYIHERTGDIKDGDVYCACLRAKRHELAVCCKRASRVLQTSFSAGSV